MMSQQPNPSFLLSINEQTFPEVALAAFRHQAKHVPIYRDWVNQLGLDVKGINSWQDIPFLPIEFFKTEKVVDQPLPENPLTFASSGTTGQVNSHHYVVDPLLYKTSLLQGFTLEYGDPKDWVIIGLLPSYLERPNASLVYMVKQLMDASGRAENRFFLHEYEALQSHIERLEAKGQKTLLIGVTFALLDFAEQCPMPLHSTTIMETGGMKGRRKEMIREEVHDVLQQAFGPQPIHSEYGMTELLSQAYSKGAGMYQTPPWMKVVIRDPYDPFTHLTDEQTGAINVIDLANWHSCSFIATADIGKTFKHGGFTVLGRLDQSEIRGCNLMAL